MLIVQKVFYRVYRLRNDCKISLAAKGMTGKVVTLTLYRTTPAIGLLAAAYSFFGIRPAR